MWLCKLSNFLHLEAVFQLLIQSRAGGNHIWLSLSARFCIKFNLKPFRLELFSLWGCQNVGPKPTDLYGKFTWKIENFSEISKRELRSNVFEVGGYKWYAYWCLKFDRIDCLIFLARFALPVTLDAHIMLYSLYLGVNLILEYHKLYKTLCSHCEGCSPCFLKF
jgi:hypothetical protein